MGTQMICQSSGEMKYDVILVGGGQISSQIATVFSVF